MPEFDAKAYREAFGLMDDPEVDEETRSFLRGKVEEFETKQPKAAMRIVAQETGDPAMLDMAERIGQSPTQQLSFGESGLEAMRRAGINKPKNREDYQRLQGVRLAGSAKSTDDGGYIKRPVTEFEYAAPPETREEIRVELEQYRAENPDEFPQEAPPQPANPDGDAVQDYLTQSDQENDQEKIAIGHGGLGHPEDGSKLPSASNRWDLYAPPEHIPEGLDLKSLATALYHLEPPVAMVRQLMVDSGKMTPEAAEALTEESDEYKRFADSLWQETYDRSVAAGKPAIRVSYMNDEDWAGKLAKGSAVAMSKIAPVAYGADLALTGGVATEAVSSALGKALGDEKLRRQVHGMRERDPLLTAGGAVLGSLAPGGLAASLYRGAASRLVPVGAGVGTRLAGAGASAGLTGAGESLIADSAQNLGELAASDMPEGEKSYRGAGDMALRALMAGTVAVPFGVAGEGGSSVAGWAVRRLREGRRGPALAQLEAAGMTTHPIRGATISDQLEAIQQRAARGGGRYPEDVLTNDIADPIAAEALRRGRETVERLGSENQAYAMGAGSRKVPVTRVAEQVSDELANLTDDAGVALPGRESDVKLLREWDARLSDTNGPKRFNFEQLENVIEGLGRLADKTPDHNPAPFKRIRAAAMGMREEFDKAGEAAMRKGDIRVSDNVAAMQMRHDVDLKGVRWRNQAAGLPPELKPRAEPAGSPGNPLPDLDFPQEQAFKSRLSGYRGAPGRESSDNALRELASGAGVEDELAMIAAQNARKEVKEAGQLRSVFGSQGSMSLYTGSPLEVIGMRLDPAMRALSRREPAPDTPISGTLYEFINSLATGRSLTRGALDPLGDLQRGVRGRASARQLGAVGASTVDSHNRRYGGAPNVKGRNPMMYADLSVEERRVLVELLGRAVRRPLPAASGE